VMSAVTSSSKTDLHRRHAFRAGGVYKEPSPSSHGL
jgi:hypothetical protein